ncbi:MAG: enoyl-CoA hydratase/isomerase family protein [Terriglobia bacterium]
MTVKTQGIQLTRSGVAAYIVLNSPPLNILGLPALRELNTLLASLPVPPEVRYLVFSGAGTRAFCAGVDVKDHLSDRVREMLETFHRVFRTLWTSEWITVAAVRGHCLGGGMELATFCDFVLAADTAQFAQPEIKLGCFPPVAAVTFPALVGSKRALELLLTGRTLSAAEAHAQGLVTRIVPAAELEAATQQLLSELNQLSPAVQALTKKVLWRVQGFDFERRLKLSEEIYLDSLMKTHDAQEGLQAFLEKRPPVWDCR